MRILVIEDDTRVASFIRRGPLGRQISGRRRSRRSERFDLAVSRDYSLIVLDSCFQR